MQKNEKIKSSFYLLELDVRPSTTVTRAASPIEKGKQARLLLLHPTLITFLQFYENKKKAISFETAF